MRMQLDMVFSGIW